MNTVPSTYPTTSDISQLMKQIGYQWSNDAQIYYNQNGSSYTHITSEGATRMYKYLIGAEPYSPISPQIFGAQSSEHVFE